jgi:hypothetical protein
MRRFGWFFTVILLLVLPGFTGCESPSNPGGQPEPEPEGPRAGLYAFSGDYVPGETEKTAESVPVLPFSPENAFSEIKDAGTPGPYLILLDNELSLLPAVSLPEGTVVVIKGLGGERIIQFYNTEAGGSLFSLSGGQTLILDENITLLGSRANSNPLVSVEQGGRLTLYSGASIQEHGGSAVRVSAGVFTLEGGTLASSGGGVTVSNGGVFTMKSGSITDNSSDGGVLVAAGGFMNRPPWGPEPEGIFVMEGGLISGNHNAAAGGGVRGNFSISGGSISGNTSGDSNPLLKNISAVPVVSGDAFVIEGYREVTEVAITLRDINGYVKTGVTGGRTYTCSAVLSGVGDPPQEVTWTLTGGNSGDTSIDSATGALRIGYDETAESLSLAATSITQSGARRVVTLPVDLYVEHSLKTKLGITTSGNSIAVVTEVFTALHEYIAAGHLSGANEKDIGIGDYVNLDSLKVTDTVVSGYAGGSFNIMNAVLPNEHGTTLRLIVAGVNSYKGLNGNGNTVADDHVVFQFQNIPVARRMEETNVPAAGYTGSEMRKYLSPAGGFESSSGCFYNGLVAAGIPAAVFYSPRRAVSGGTGIEIIEDPVWLPTARELNALAINEAAGEETPQILDAEAAADQPIFGYYSAVTIPKYQASGSAFSYWTGSPDTQGRFIRFSSPNVFGRGNYFSSSATSTSQGVAPAFCVR